MLLIKSDRLLADYSMVETPIDDDAQMVSQAATARALGLGLVPSLRPRSTAENRVAIATLHALGGQPIVPWDVDVGHDERGLAKRFFGRPQDDADLDPFVRANRDLLDRMETAVQVGLVVPVDKGQRDRIKHLVRRLTDHGVSMAFVPVGGSREYLLRADPERLRHFSLLLLTNEEANYSPEVLRAITQSGVPHRQASDLLDQDIAKLRPFLVTPGSEGLRLIPRADPKDEQRLVVHIIDTRRGERNAESAHCARRLGIRREQFGPGSIASVRWATPFGRNRPQVSFKDNEMFFTLKGCPLWGVLALRMNR
ncbi:MAG: hypothetical protein ACFCVA_15940 [Gammaproteobacteria bacterium]